MENSYTTIKNLISFLYDVFTAKKIKSKESDFFKLTDDLDDMLHKYYISFKNNSELIEQIAYNYNLIKDMSFPDLKGDHIYVKDLSNHSKPNYSNEQYNSYALFVHSYLVRVFEKNLRLNKEIVSKRITVKGKKIYEIIKRVNLEIEFLRDDIAATDFINVLLGKSDKEIHLNISNRDFHYLLTKIGEYFFNFSFTAVAKTNKIYSKNGKLITPNNLNNSKCDFPNLKDEIDVNFNLGR
jgi:hypothetical protein